MTNVQASVGTTVNQDIVGDFDTMNIWVGCIAAYNNGQLHGEWINASSDVDEMQDKVNEVLKTSPVPDAEEWMIYDVEDLPTIGEGSSLESVAEYVNFIEDADIEGLDSDAANAAADNFGGPNEALEAIKDRFHGSWSTFKEYAENLFDDCYAHDLPEFALRYFDYDAFERDLECDYDVLAYSGGVLVFSH